MSLSLKEGAEKMSRTSSAREWVAVILRRENVYHA